MVNQIYVWLFLIGIVALIVIISGLVTRCPECKKWWVRKSEGSKEIDRKGGYKTVTRYDIQRNNKGEEIGRIERKEQVYVTRVKYMNYYRCENCQHKWTTISTSEHEE